MNKYILLFSLLFTLSCNHLAGQDEKGGFDIIPVSKVMVDESEIVHSRMPLSLRPVNDSALACIVDYKHIVIYSTKTGQVLTFHSTDSLLSHSGFDIVDYIKTYCIPDYPDREYMFDKEEIAKRPAQPSQTFFIVAPIRTLDSVAILLSVLTPYKTAYVHEGRKTMAHVLTSSFLVADVNFNKGTITKIRPLHEGLFDVNAYQTIPNPEYGSLLSDNKVFMCLYPNPNKAGRGKETGFFAIGEHPAFKALEIVYPDELAIHPKRWAPRKHFVREETGSILFNSLFDIYRIDTGLKTKKVISLKQQMDIERYEHINCFAKLRNGDFIIQTVVADSGKHYYDFRFYDPETDKLSNSKLRMVTRNISPNVIFNEDRLIFFSRDDEHFYIETYKIVGT